MAEPILIIKNIFKPVFCRLLSILVILFGNAVHGEGQNVSCGYTPSEKNSPVYKEFKNLKGDLLSHLNVVDLLTKRSSVVINPKLFPDSDVNGLGHPARREHERIRTNPQVVHIVCQHYDTQRSDGSRDLSINQDLGEIEGLYLDIAKQVYGRELSFLLNAKKGNFDIRCATVNDAPHGEPLKPSPTFSELLRALSEIGIELKGVCPLKAEINGSQ